MLYEGLDHLQGMLTFGATGLEPRHWTLVSAETSANSGCVHGPSLKETQGVSRHSCQMVCVGNTFLSSIMINVFKSSSCDFVYIKLFIPVYILTKQVI